jgi:hypothetical protein
MAISMADSEIIATVIKATIPHIEPWMFFMGGALYLGFKIYTEFKKQNSYEETNKLLASMLITLNSMQQSQNEQAKTIKDHAGTLKKLSDEIMFLVKNVTRHDEEIERLKTTGRNYNA